MRTDITNPFLARYRDYYNLAELTYVGGIDYINACLVKHSRETNSHFNKRLEMTHNINSVSKIIQILSSFILSGIERKLEIESELKDNYLYKIDLEQNFDEFIEKKIAEYLLFDNIISIVDSDEQRAYCHDINYRDVFDYQREKGHLLFIDIALNEKTIVRFTKDLYQYTDYENYFKDGGPFWISERPNKIKEIPIVLLNSKLDTNKPYFRDAIYIQKAIFNHYNSINQQLIDTGFPILMLPGGGSDEVDLNTIRVMRYLTNGIKPEYVSPDLSHLDFYLTYIENLQEQLLNSLNIYRDKTTSNTSGLSKSYDYSIMATFLSRLAAKMQKYEMNMWKMIAKFDSRIKPEKIEIRYKNDFDIKTLSEQMNNLMQASSMGISSTLSKELEKTIARKFVSNESILEKIDKEIEGKNFDIPASTEFETKK